VEGRVIARSGIKIALDVMGGDRGPAEAVAGAVMASREDGAEVLLVGRRAAIDAELAKHGGATTGVEVVDAADVIEMGEQPAPAVRAKPDSSLVVGVDLVRSGRAAGFVSAGNSGAVLVASLLALKRIRGVDRPALATLFPTLSGHCLVCDIGANPDCRPEQILQFGIMGATYLERVFDRPRPRVGLLSNGEEDSKGNALAREAHVLLRDSGLNFVGNVEGTDLFHHKADVVVTDGFTGNVVLKAAEESATFLAELIRQEAKRDLMGMIGGLLLKPAFARIRRRVSYDEYGGAPLLGIDGVCIKAHGRSNARAIRSALRVARHAAERGLPDAIRAGIQAQPTTMVTAKE
jgi:glycerol-3-phosphate acyltransferase PlsX